MFNWKKTVVPDRQLISGPFKPQEGNMWVARIGVPGGDHDRNPWQSQLCLYEDGQKLMFGHQSHDSIRLGGRGRYSHWESRLFFSTTDNSDPNTNGRRYSFDFSFDQESWYAATTERSAQRWLLHPDGASVLSHGSSLVPPPLTANLGLTNKCNLRCEICGSQKYLDATGVRRRHMDFSKFDAVAEAVFPFLSVVELNSQGDPLLHPRIVDVLNSIERHRCEFKIQHNGTLLRDEMVDSLLDRYGTFMLSLDAVGPKFNEVRAGGDWTKAEPGLKRLLRQRDPKRISVGAYPTWTTRTISEAIPVANWCAEHGVDVLSFHAYWNVQDSREVAPTPEDYSRTCDELRDWCGRNGNPLRVLFEGDVLNTATVREKRTEFPDLEKRLAIIDCPHVIFPVSRHANGAHPFMTCAAPYEYIEIGLDGQISVCCRAQDVALGCPTSLQEFANVWLGRDYELIRTSLRRGATSSYPLPNCESCVKFVAPSEAGDRRAIDYSKPAAAREERLSIAGGDEIVFDSIQKEIGFCHIVTFPLGLGSGSYVLYEDENPLGPAGSLHDDIRKLGKGRYHIGALAIYFSTLDGTDARRNGRVYSLKRSTAAAQQ